MQSELNRLVSSTEPTTAPATKPAAPKKKRRLSAAGRAAIIAGTKARWARFHAAANGQEAEAKPKKRTMSPAAKARLSMLAKARWKKAKAAGKKGL